MTKAELRQAISDAMPAYHGGVAVQKPQSAPRKRPNLKYGVLSLADEQLYHGRAFEKQALSVNERRIERAIHCI